MERFERHPIPVLFLGVTGAALSAIFVRFSNAPSIILATYRLLWTVLILTPVVLGKKEFRKELHTIDIRTILMCALSGIFLALHFTFWFESLNFTSVASSTAIVCTEVIWVALGYSFFPDGKLSKKAWLCIAVTIIGSLIIALADSSGNNGLAGDLLSLAAAIFAAVYTIIGRIARRNMTTTSYTYIVYVFCGLSLCLTVFIKDLSFTGYGISAWIVGLLLCVFSTILGHSIFSWSLKYLSPAFISTFKLCQAPIAAVFAFFLFHEVPGLLLITGGIITILGTILYARQED